MLNETPRRRQLCLSFCAVLAAALLWRWQRIFWLECADYIRADMVGHIALALGRHDYSLSGLLIRVLWSLFDEDRARTLLSLLLTLNQAAGVLTLWLLLRGVLPELDGAEALLAALLANVCGPWIFPGQTGMYLGVYNGNVWHNMTVLFSRTWIPPALLCFWQLWEARRGKLPVRGGWGFLSCCPSSGCAISKHLRRKRARQSRCCTESAKLFGNPHVDPLVDPAICKQLPRKRARPPG